MQGHQQSCYWLEFSWNIRASCEHCIHVCCHITSLWNRLNAPVGSKQIYTITSLCHIWYIWQCVHWHTPLIITFRGTSKHLPLMHNAPVCLLCNITSCAHRGMYCLLSRAHKHYHCASVHIWGKFRHVRTYTSNTHRCIMGHLLWVFEEEIECL